MVFAEGGAAAVEELDARPFDVVVSDMRMPGLNGADLLRLTREKRPDAVRIILSGYATQEDLLRAVGPAHNFLSKPCDRETLVQTIRRSLKVRERLSSPVARELILKVESLPCLPDAYKGLEHCLAQGGGLEQVGALVRQDVGLSTKLLQFANSSYFGLEEGLSDPEKAVRCLGIDTVRGLVATAELFSSRDSPRMQALHREAVETLRVVRELAGDHPEVAMDQLSLAAMCAGIGSVVLSDHYPNSYPELEAESIADGIGLAELEHSAYGLTGDQVGGLLLELWGIPHPVVEAVAFWRTPSGSESRKPSPVAFLHVAKGLLAESAGTPIAWDHEFLERTGLDARLPEWRQRVHGSLTSAA